jgi:hypothetical protein
MYRGGNHLTALPAVIKNMIKSGAIRYFESIQKPECKMAKDAPVIYLTW